MVDSKWQDMVRGGVALATASEYLAACALDEKRSANALLNARASARSFGASAT